MAKKLISVWLSLTILLFSSISIYADEEVIQGDFFLKNIVINGENIVNYQLSNPVLFYQDHTYVPMDTEMERILGIENTILHPTASIIKSLDVCVSFRLCIELSNPE